MRISSITLKPQLSNKILLQNCIILLQNEKVDNGIPPPNLEDVQLSFVPGVLFDNHPVGQDFGDCLLQPPSIVYKGEMVKVRYEDSKKVSNL